MVTTFKLNTSELDIDFIESIKRLFKNKEVEILIKPLSNFDRTTYSNDLLQSVSEIENSENIKTFSISEFDKFSKELVND